MLIYSGFDPQKEDNFGSSPLHLACISGNIMAVKLLCAKVFIRTTLALDAMNMTAFSPGSKKHLTLTTGNKQI